MYLDSRDGSATGGSSSEFSYVFDDAMVTRDDEGMLVSLLSATVPYSFYNIRLGVNDALRFTVFAPVAGGSQQRTFTIDAGNYTATSLRTAVQEKMTAECTSAGIATAVVVTYDRTSQKFKFATDTADRQITLDFADINSFHIEMGFSGTTNPQFTTASDCVSEQVMDINGSIHAVHIRTDLPTLAVFDSQSGKASDILAKVTLNTNPGGIIFHDPRDTKHECLLRSSGVRGIRIRLTDERDRVLSLNGLHFQVGILFRFVSLKTPDPLQDLRRLLSALPQPQVKAKKDQRRRVLKKGKSKIQKAQRLASAASKTPEKSPPKKQSASK
jgi:hypothetical protein